MSVYKQIFAPDHPKASASNCVYEHVVVVEAALGRHLPDGAEVHHIDGNGRNNARSNLVICQDRAYHKLLHVRARIVGAGGDPDYQSICSTCKRVLPRDLFWKMAGNLASGIQKRCKECSRRADKGRNHSKKQEVAA